MRTDSNHAFPRMLNMSQSNELLRGGNPTEMRNHYCDWMPSREKGEVHGQGSYMHDVEALGMNSSIVDGPRLAPTFEKMSMKMQDKWEPKARFQPQQLFLLSYP